MTHKATSKFWERYYGLPAAIQLLADKNYELLKADLRHPSLHLKEVKPTMWSVRVGIGYRALALVKEDIFYWFWIGPHAEYNRIIR
jgi:hypothetical protein